MDVVNLVDSDSEESIVELEIPPKTPPPLIDIVEETELIMNFSPLRQNVQQITQLTTVEETVVVEPDTTNTTIIDTIEDLKVISPDHWTERMMRFYNSEKKGDRRFSVTKLQSKMNHNPELWSISHKHLKTKKYRIRCYNCWEFGHKTRECNEDRTVPKCYMCGGTGHGFENCPNTICLNCGSRSYQYMRACSICSASLDALCSICRLFGHYTSDCSNNWRKYHHTTNETNTLAHPTLYKADTDYWCSNCGVRGHLSFECHINSKLRIFPETVPFVIHNSDSRANAEGRIPATNSNIEDIEVNPIQSTTQSRNFNNFIDHVPEINFLPSAKRGRPNTPPRLTRYFDSTQELEDNDLMSVSLPDYEPSPVQVKPKFSSDTKKRKERRKRNREKREMKIMERKMERVENRERERNEGWQSNRQRKKRTEHTEHWTHNQQNLLFRNPYGHRANNYEAINKTNTKARGNTRFKKMRKKAKQQKKAMINGHILME